MAAFNFGLSVCVLVYITGCLAAPPAQHEHADHKHHAPDAHETFKITLSVNSGAENPNWVIDNDTADKDVKTIIGFLKAVRHTKYTLPALLGYRGLKIDYQSATETKSFDIPRCKFIKLEYLLVNLTSGNAVSTTKKKHVFDILTKCLDDKKAAAAASTEAPASTKSTAAPTNP